MRHETFINIYIHHLYSPTILFFPTPQMAPKKRPLPLHVSLRRIEEERVNVAKRTEARIAMLFQQTDYSVDKATQTEIPMREVLVEIDDWHCCLNTSCFCILLLCMNLLFCQWLYLQTNYNTV